jgi:hypothetical protein
MSMACTAESDVICRPCSMCTGVSYEVAACSSSQDTICIGAAFPVNNIRWNKLIQHSSKFPYDIIFLKRGQKYIRNVFSKASSVVNKKLKTCT